MENDMKVQRFDSLPLDATYFTDEGYLVDHPIVTSVGIFVYHNPDGSERRELRLPEEVFAEKSLASYKGKPIIVTHDAGYVDTDNVKEESIGTILSEGYRDGDDVRAEIIIHDTDSLKKYKMRELSCGYNLRLDETPGVWEGQPYDAIQRDIEINHLALVDKARAGEQARLNIDGQGHDCMKGEKLNMEKTTKRTDGAPTPEELAAAVEAFKKRRAERSGAATDGSAAAEPTAAPGVADNDPATAQDKPDAVQMVKDRRDRRDSEGDPADMPGAMGVIAQQDEDIDTLLGILGIGAKGLTMIRDWLQKLTDLTDKLGGSQRVLSVLAAAFTAMLVAMNLKKIGAAITGFTKLARAIGLGHGKALAFFAVFLLLALVIEDFISFMRGDKSLLGTMLERAGVDCEKLRQNIVGVWTKIKQAIGYIGEGIRNVVVPIFEGIRTAAVVAFEEIQQAVAKVAPGIAQFFKELSSGKVDKKKWTDIGESIGRIAVGVVAVIAAVKGISAIFGVITTVISVVKAVISVIKLAFVVVKSIITVIKVVGAVISVLASAFGPVILAIAAAIAIGVLLWKNWDKIREAAGNLLEGIKATIGNVRDAIVTGIQAAIDWITSLPAEALKWGSDIIDGIVSGIQSAVGRVGEAVKGVADKIKSFLGFSEPEDGPLSDFHTYMPDMIDLMASGITSGKKKVKDALEGMTGEMSVIAKANVVSKATGRGATGRTTGGRTVTQNVNINNQFNGDRAGQQKSSEAMDKAAGDATGEMARALAFAK